MKNILNKISAFFKTLTGLQWFLFITVPFAFFSFFSLAVQTEGYKPEKNGTIASWWVMGILAGLIAIYGLIKTAKNSNS